MDHLTDVLPVGATRARFPVRGGSLAAVRRDPPDARGTVLLVPGFTGSKEDFGLLTPLLAGRGRRTVAIDQRGQYESAGPDDEGAYTTALLGEDVLSVARVLPGPVHLVGHSFGGLVARAAVLAEPDTFSTLTLMSSGPAALGGPRGELMGLLRPLLAAQGMAAVYEASEALAAGDTGQPPTPAQARAFLRTRFLAGSSAGLQAMGDALLTEPDRVAELRGVDVPVLVLHGDADDAWSPAVQRDMAERLAAAYAVVPGTAHSPAAEDPEATAEALLRFWS